MTIQEQRIIMVEYLKLRLYLEDWHGVRDAAADLERMEAIDRHTESKQLQAKFRVYT
jgi:hypothetical protein